MFSVVSARQLSGEQQAAVRVVLAESYSADGVQALGEVPMNALGTTNIAVEHLLVTASDGTVIGYASVIPGRDSGPSTAELVVTPAARGYGAGKSLVQRVLATAPPGGIKVWAHGNLPAARAIAEKLGLSVRRELRQLYLGVGAGAETLPPIPQYEDVVLRNYSGPSDEGEILRVNNAAFGWHPEQGGWTSEQITERINSPWFDPHGLFLAFSCDNSQRLMGFHWTKVESQDQGEVYVVGVDPVVQGRGLGRLLTLYGMYYLAERVSKITLYVESNNTIALKTYENLGFKPFQVDIAYGYI